MHGVMTEPQTELLALMNRAHDESARRGNISSVVLGNTAIGSGSYTNAVAAALLTLGGVHGPLQQTQELLEREDAADVAERMLVAGKKVPGWGNAFVKFKFDPAWAPVDLFLKEHFPVLRQRLYDITMMFHKNGKHIYPNPSAYTAVTAIVLGVPARACASLFIAARLKAWTDIYLDNTKECV